MAIRNSRELGRAVTAVELADHGAVGDVERREQAGDAVAVVVMGAPLGHAGHHRQHRLGPVQRLDLGFLVDAQHHGPLRRVVVETHDVDDLLHEQRVVRQLEPVLDMGFEVEPLPDPPDGGRTQAAALGHRGTRPVGGILRQFLQGRHHDVLDLVEQDRRRPAGPWLVEQAVQPRGDEPGPPAVHRGHAHPQICRDLLVRDAIGARQHDPRTHRQELRRLRPPSPPPQLGPLDLGQHQVGLRPPGTCLVLQAGQPLGGESGPPLARRRHTDREPLRHSGVRQAIRARQDHPRTLGQSP